MTGSHEVRGSIPLGSTNTSITGSRTQSHLLLYADIVPKTKGSENRRETMD
jgi:hypothetical protein